MKMRAVAAALPSKRVSNSDILASIAEHSAADFDGEFDVTLRRIDYLLRYSGSEYRRWLDEGERPIDLLRIAAKSALDQAGIGPSDVDLLVYTGIGRGFIEPGGAYHSAAAIGCNNAHCFDIIDACMSWVRAVQIAQAMFATGMFATALIVNAEFNLRTGGPVFPDLYRLPDEAALESRFPAFTLGEAATATVLTADDYVPWRFEFTSRPDLADLCNVTLDGYEGFCDPTDKLAKNGVGQFTSYGAAMHNHGAPESLKVLDRLGVDTDAIAALFTHASSKRFWQGLADESGLGDKIYHVYQETGNLVSASIPAAIASAVEVGRLRVGDTAVGWVGSAGMSFGAFEFVL